MSEDQDKITEQPEEEKLAAPEATAPLNVEEEIAKLKDLLMRAMAEAENTRKRAEKEKLEALKYATSSFARDLLAVADNLRRALENLPENPDEKLKPLVDGLKMTESELLSVFGKHGIKQVEAKPGEPFNHDQQQAMMEIPTDEFKPGTIAQVMQTGYTLHDRLLRPAMVGVAKGK